jgi:hypothetical protein
MNQQRKEIIIKEIEYWKKNRLLKEQYCDYLLTLYSEGEYESREHSNGFIRRALVTLIPNIMLLVFTVLFLFIYFTELPFSLQTALNLILLGFSVGFVFFYKNKNRTYYTLFVVFSFIFFFFISIAIIDFWLIDLPYAIEGTILAHCTFLFGRSRNLRYLTISGVSGTILTLGITVLKLFI